MGKSTNYDLPPGLVSKLNTFLLAQIWSTGFRGGPAVIKQQDYSDDKPCEVQYKQANLVFVDTIRTWIRFYQETVSKNLWSSCQIVNTGEWVSSFLTGSTWAAACHRWNCAIEPEVNYEGHSDLLINSSRITEVNTAYRRSTGRCVPTCTTSWLLGALSMTKITRVRRLLTVRCNSHVASCHYWFIVSHPHLLLCSECK